MLPGEVLHQYNICTLVDNLIFLCTFNSYQQLVNKDLGIQLAFVLVHGKPIASLAQVSFLGLLRKFELIDELSLGVLPMGQSTLRCPFTLQV
jgi:hypothetical protein